MFKVTDLLDQRCQENKRKEETRTLVLVNGNKKVCL